LFCFTSHSIVAAGAKHADVPVWAIAIQSSDIKEVTINVPIYNSKELLQSYERGFPPEFKDLMVSAPVTASTGVRTRAQSNPDFEATHTVPAKFLVAFSKETGQPEPQKLCLFIRPVYEILYQRLQRFWNACPDVVCALAQLFGLSGIGKTQFIIYCLYRVLKNDPTTPIVVASFDSQAESDSDLPTAFLLNVDPMLSYPIEHIHKHLYSFVDSVHLEKGNYAHYQLFVSSNDEHCESSKPSTGTDMQVVIFSLAPFSYAELCCLNYICGYLYRAPGHGGQDGLYMLPPALLYVRYLLFRGNIRNIYALAPLLTTAISDYPSTTITDIITNAPVSSKPDPVVSNAPVSDPVVSLLFCPYDVKIETTTFVLDLTPPIACSWAIPVKIDVNNPITETYPQNKLLLEKFMALQLQSRYCQHIDDKDKRTEQYMPEIIQYIKSTLGDHLSVPDTLLSVIFGDDVHEQYDRGNLYLSIAYISFLEGDPMTYFTKSSKLTGTCGTLSGSYFIRVSPQHIRTSLHTDPPIDCDDYTPLSARVYCFYTDSNQAPIYCFVERSFYLSSVLSFLHMVASDKKSFTDVLTDATGSSGVGVAYEKQCIREITRLPVFTLNPHGANEPIFSASFDTEALSVHRNLHNFDEISRFLRPNVWLVPSIHNFPTIDLIGMSSDHEVVAIQITKSNTHKVKQTGNFVSAIKKVVTGDRSVNRVCIVIYSPKQAAFQFDNYVTLVATLRTHMIARVNVSLHHYPAEIFGE
jgi:hypothetical protein